MQESDGHAKMSITTIETIRQLPMNGSTCYCLNQIEVLQTLGNYTFASRYGTDEFLQKSYQPNQKVRYNQK